MSSRMSPLPRWPLLSAMQDTKDPHLVLSIKDFVNSDDGSGGKAISRVPSTRPGRPMRGKDCSSPMCSTTDWATVARTQDGFLQCSRRSVPDRPRRPRSSGRASAAIAPVHAGHDVVVREQSAFTCGGATFLNLAAEPLVMVDRAGQQVERNLVD